MSSNCVEKYLGQSWVGLLFTADQKYVRVRSSQGPSLLITLLFTLNMCLSQLWALGGQAGYAPDFHPSSQLWLLAVITYPQKELVWSKKTGRQSLQNRLQFIKEVKKPWNNLNLNNDSIRILLKNSFFKYITDNWLIMIWFHFDFI